MGDSPGVLPFSRLYGLESRWRFARAALMNALRRDRRCRAYCIGLPKSGTHSVAGLFEASLRVAHEPLPDPLILNMPLAEAAAPLVQRRLLRLLAYRDRVLSLDIESSHLLGPFWPLLAARFADAKFIVPVRHPEDWLRSMTGDEIKVRSYERYALWRRALDFYFPGEPAHPPEEAPLREAGIASIASHLGYWHRFHSNLLETLAGGSVPREKVFILRTTDLRLAAADLARFLGVDPGQLMLDSSHLYRGQDTENPLDRVPGDHVKRLIARHCATLWTAIESSYGYREGESTATRRSRIGSHYQGTGVPSSAARRDFSSE